VTRLEQYSIIVGLIIGIVTLALPILKKINKAMIKWNDFMRDWVGEEEAPGRDRIPGVMERLNKLDGELSHNGGSSIKDAVHRIENMLCNLDDRMGVMEEKLEEKLRV
jgi:hypothetical protein